MDTSVRRLLDYLGQAPAEEAPLGIGGHELECSAVGRRGLALPVQPSE